MQCRRRGGGSGELAVFSATRYFAGLVDRVGLSGTFMKESSTQSALHEPLAGVNPSEATRARSKSCTAAATAEYSKLSLSSSSMSLSSSRQSIATAAAASSSSMRCLSDLVKGYGELGEVIMRDRRLQGVRVVRGGDGGHEERWVVRCGVRGGDDSHGRSFLGAGDAGDGGEDGGGDHNWESDTSSDLFELEDLKN